ncbi:MAG: hypothetical protein ACRDN9_15635, partial [Streptosporangiaceae bacterium]
MSVEPLERSPTDKRVRRPGRGKGSDLAVRVAQPLILLLLPLLAWQGKHVRSRVPWLPEAEGP